MRLRSRLIFLVLSLTVLVVVGRIETDGFSFLLNQFWFTAGFFLLLLLSLIDQPHFSKDANVFVNATTAWVSLLLVSNKDRNGIWWIFLSWSMYLLVSSYTLMWVRTKDLSGENVFVRVLSRVNREIGRPEALFSAFFIWGAIQQFGPNSPKLSPLFLFWAIFMVLNLPAFAVVLDKLISGRAKTTEEVSGKLLHVISPKIAEVALAPSLASGMVGGVAHFEGKNGIDLACGIFIDDRVVAGKRIGRIAITSMEAAWASISAEGAAEVRIKIEPPGNCLNDGMPLSVVDVGTEIGKLVFFIHPDKSCDSGEILWVQMNATTKAFYQVISASVRQQALPDGNSMQVVQVSAGQLGSWDTSRCRFEPVTWVAPAGEIVYKATANTCKDYKLPLSQEVVGSIPNSDFPVHVSIEDIVTHNTAIIGVTGCGKSFLAFYLIEAMICSNIKVLILDISRQHDIYLSQHNPTALRTSAEVKAWWEGDSKVAIHQYAVDGGGYPTITADFVQAAFDEASKARLERGKNHPARLCIVFEEAHSLIPEWNQVAQQYDPQQVNRTARHILQGRKYGMGALIITQRTANVTKTILNQCNTIFALQSFDQTGLDFLRNYMGEEYSHAISTLPIRHAILVGKASSSTRPLLICVKDLAERWKELVLAGNSSGEIETQTAERTQA